MTNQLTSIVKCLFYVHYSIKSYVHQHLKKTQNRVQFETTVETNKKSISRQTTRVFDYFYQTILIR